MRLGSLTPTLIQFLLDKVSPRASVLAERSSASHITELSFPSRLGTCESASFSD